MNQTRPYPLLLQPHAQDKNFSLVILNTQPNQCLSQNSNSKSNAKCSKPKKMLLQTISSSPPCHNVLSFSISSSGFIKIRPKNLSFQIHRKNFGIHPIASTNLEEPSRNFHLIDANSVSKKSFLMGSVFLLGQTSWMMSAQPADANQIITSYPVYETSELFELGIQLSYVLSLLALLGVGTFFVIRQVLVRRELDLSAKELQEQVRSGDASATEFFELGAVMLRRKYYPAAAKYLRQAIERWDGDDQDLAQVYNALGVTYTSDGKVEKGISQFEMAVKLQPGYVTAWNNLGDAYEKKKDLKAALQAFEEVLLFDPNNKVARPRRDGLKDQVKMFKGVSVKYSKKKS